jgi:large repetitive protein
MGLGPIVKTLPVSGKVGSTVRILGNKLTGATSVTFDGVAATFTVVSSTEITATVTTGATTGVVQVVTSAGTTLTSNLVFTLP